MHSLLLQKHRRKNIRLCIIIQNNKCIFSVLTYTLKVLLCDFSIGYYILVYLQGYFFHCINTRQQEMLCHSLFLSGKMRFFFCIRVVSKLSDGCKAVGLPLLSSTLHAPTFLIFNHRICSNRKKVVFIFNPVFTIFACLIFCLSLTTTLRSWFGLGPAISVS